MSAKRRLALHAFPAAQRSHRRPGSPSRSTAALLSLSGRTHLRRCCRKFPFRRYPSWDPYTIRVRSLPVINTILADAAIATSPLGVDLLARFPEDLGQGAWIFTE